MSTPIKVSYGVLIATLIVAAWLHLGTLLLAAFFSYFALRKLHAVTKRKWLSLILFVICLVGIAYAAGYFTRAAWRALPDIADSSIPSATAWAEKRNIELPFTDFETLKAFLIAQVKDEIHYLNDVAHFAGAATTLFVLIVIGIVVATSLFFRSWRHQSVGSTAKDANNLYAACATEIATRFRDFYHSFETVLGAQIIISCIISRTDVLPAPHGAWILAAKPPPPARSYSLSMRSTKAWANGLRPSWSSAVASSDCGSTDWIGGFFVGASDACPAFSVGALFVRSSGFRCACDLGAAFLFNGGGHCGFYRQLVAGRHPPAGR